MVGDVDLLTGGQYTATRAQCVKRTLACAVNHTGGLLDGRTHLAVAHRVAGFQGNTVRHPIAERIGDVLIELLNQIAEEQSIGVERTPRVLHTVRIEVGAIYEAGGVAGEPDAGFVDGPNLYAYVRQNPWSKFDPDGQFWSALITVGFAAYDTYQYATGQTSGAEYAKAMALNGAALLADVATSGQGGGLAVRAANATIKVAKAVDKANNIMKTAQAAVDMTESVVAAVEAGDGRRLTSTAGRRKLETLTSKWTGERTTTQNAEGARM